MPWRTASDELERAGVLAATRALDAAGIEVVAHGTDLSVVVPGDERLELQVKAVSRLDGAKARSLVDRPDQPVGLLVVADEVTRDAQQILRTARIGFVDRRGHLYLRDEALHLDLDIDPDPRLAATRPSALVRGRSGITIAAALLLAPDESVGVRELARRSGLPVSTTSKALAPLRDAALVDNGTPVVPDLFWSLADMWTPARTPLAERPPLSAGVLAGTLAAAELGAPVAVAADSPPDLYVAAELDVRALERRYRTVAAASRAAAVAVEPTPLVTQTAGDGVAHPLFVALDLAQDRARGREILDGWHPSGGHRVW